MDQKVFKSDVIRTQTAKTDELYDLLRRSPVIPVQKETNNQQPAIDFQPVKDKYYMSKRRSKLKVKTVRDIRRSFEKDVNDFLPVELEKQQSYLLRKIRSGFSEDKGTKTVAKNILKQNKPISRPAWQMLMNINPNNNNHPLQYVLWRGSKIRITGSNGGSNKFLCKFDLSRNSPQVPTKNLTNSVSLSNNNNKNLLKTSVNIKFKPGPLSKKYNLDCSYQKHQVGKTELVNLPTPVLEIYPCHGHALDSTITNYLHDMRNLDGVVSEEWAQMAATAVGTVKDGKLLKEPPSSVQFQLCYRNGQKKILMRNNGDNTINNSCSNNEKPVEKDDFDEIKTMLNEMLSSVEISLEQNNLLIDDEPREVSLLDINVSCSDNIKDRAKKRFCELGRLAVTVIQLPEERIEDPNKKCEKSFCGLGCICSSLECRKIVKGHCGRIRCMFQCKCNFSKYSSYENCPEVLSRLVSLDKEVANRLAKEERKFHQTVVVTGEKSIVLKSEKRNLKIPKKYENFYKTMCLKNNIPSTRLLSVVSLKLNCENVEPWCMVHNLYRCYCKGRFLESNSASDNKFDHQIPVNDSNTEERYCIDINKRDFIGNKRKTYTISHNDNPEQIQINEDSDTGLRCSRVLPFSKRKYNLAYYQQLARKIVDMETNDHILQKKLLQLGFQCAVVNSASGNLPIDNSVDENELLQRGNGNYENATTNSSNVVLGSTIVIDDSESDSSDLTTRIEPPKMLRQRDLNITQNGSLVKWLEVSYKKYKDEIEKGIEKASLDKPTVGTMTLYSWSFIKKRYSERKNFFLVSKSPPYRIFVAITTNHPMFGNCINIDEIRFADLHRYPATVKSLLTNSNDLEKHFFIFRGLGHCWELVGSACRIDENSKDTEMENTGNESPRLSLEMDDNESCNDSNDKVKDRASATDSQEVHKETTSYVAETSKWFVMTIEKDFTELQFFKKGFFVKYESIIKAINVSRISGNTVRLSSVQQSEHSTSPHFGIYAIPNTDQYCVFIGPYEKDEPLGIETVKSYADTNCRKKKTRGVWITTNKVDDFKVIDNPLCFMPRMAENEIQLDNIDQQSTSQSIAIPVPKKIKRIVIRKTNSGFFKVMPKEDETETINYSDLNTECEQTAKNKAPLKTSCVANKHIAQSAAKRPVAEIAPQVKDPSKIGRISVLNLDQVNQKLLQMSESGDSLIEDDIEKFLATSIIRTSPSITSNEFTPIWIQCKTIQGLGYLKGKMRADSFISFEFPGFKLSQFYKKDEAIQKINQVLSRKVYVPEHLKLEWEIVHSDSALCSTMLKSEDLRQDTVLTESGLIHKSTLTNSFAAEYAGGMQPDSSPESVKAVEVLL